MSFFREMKRRNVFRVAVAYAAVAWLLMQLAALLETSLELPAWFDKSVIVALAIGFPIALILAWALELTPGGVRATQGAETGEAASKRKSRMLNHITIGVLAATALVLLVDRSPIGAVLRRRDPNLAGHCGAAPRTIRLQRIRYTRTLCQWYSSNSLRL